MNGENTNTAINNHENLVTNNSNTLDVLDYLQYSHSNFEKDDNETEKPE